MSNNRVVANGRTVLIIEDEIDIREALSEMLDLEGYFVFAACNGLEGLDYLRTHVKPKLILLDVMMPVMGGVEFLRIIKSDPSLSSIPVYIFSANANFEELPGALGLIRKPASYEAIMKVVKNYCE